MHFDSLTHRRGHGKKDGRREREGDDRTQVMMMMMYVPSSCSFSSWRLCLRRVTVGWLRWRQKWRCQMTCDAVMTLHALALYNKTTHCILTDRRRPLITSSSQLYKTREKTSEYIHNLLCSLR